MYLDYSSSLIFMDAEQSFKVNVSYRIVDTARFQLKRRFDGHRSVIKVFIFLAPQNLVKLSAKEVETSARKVIKENPSDFSEDLEYELRAFVTEYKAEIASRESVIGVLKILLNSHVGPSFPQLHNLLVLFLTIPVTVATAERSFSKLIVQLSRYNIH